MEYMALEKPDIVTDGIGPSELVKEGFTGYHVREGDAYQLAEKILFLLDHQNLCFQKGVEKNALLKIYLQFISSRNTG